MFKKIIIFLCSLPGILAAAPQRLPSQEIIDRLQHDLRNCEAEIQMLNERLNNQEATMLSLREQLLEAHRNIKESLKNQASSFENKISQLESTNKNLVLDLQQFRKHANDSTSALTEHGQQLANLEKLASEHSSNQENIKSALHFIMNALHIKETPSTKSYVIKEGDTLQKIAKAHNITTKALKEANQLTDDKIIVGKTLQIP